MKLETDQNSLAQFGRKNNVALTGIPKIVKDNELGENVLKICNNIDVNVRSSNTKACHRSGKLDQQKYKKIIMFINQKNVKNILINKKNLKNFNNRGRNFSDGTKIFAKKNITPINESTEFHCR